MENAKPPEKKDDRPLIDFKFGDLPSREDSERWRLARRHADLTAKLNERKKLPDDEQRELDRLDAIKAESNGFKPLNEGGEKRIDPLFLAVRDLFNDESQVTLIGTKLTDFDKVGIFMGEQNPTIDELVRVSLVMGFLTADGITPPRATVDAIKKEMVADVKDRLYPGFVEAFYIANGSATRLFKLGKIVLPHLAEEGGGTVKCVEFAKVVRCLDSKGITADNEIQFPRRINECLNKIQGREDQIDYVGISLTNLLTSATEYQIKPDNVRLMGPIICSAMFEELKVFEVLDKLVELSQNGMLPIGEGDAGKKLYLYWKDTPNRISQNERRNIYSTTLGIPGGDNGGSPNREFNDLWLRFVSAVSSLVRQRTADRILRSNLPGSIGQQQVRKAARDLALNLSARGYGMTFYLAKDLNAQISEIISILGSPEIRSCFGASNMWQVIDQVATLELGGARNSARYSSMASSGAIITAWLANKVDRYNKVTSAAVINVDEVLSLDPPTSNEPTMTPTDYDLVNACELWLADTATSEERIEEMAQPREAPMMTSRPVQIPAIAREMMEQAGVGMPGLGLGMATKRQ